MRVSDTDYLIHHGVKGMRWGIRKERDRKTQKRDTRSEDRKRYEQIRSKKPSELSNRELRSAINRHALETQYKALDRRSLSMGKTFVTGTGAVLLGVAVKEAVKIGVRKVIR